MDNKMNVNLICLPMDKVIFEVIKMMDYEPGIKEIFKARKDRLDASNVVSLITLENKEIVGFLNLVTEDLNDVYFLDMGIKEKYRNLGIGKEAIKIIKENIKDKYIVGETKQDNISTNTIATKLNHQVLYKEDDRVFYLIGDEKEKIDFIASGKLEELKLCEKLRNKVLKRGCR